MSFSLTTAQVRAGTKTVTRRMGWEYLKAGERVMACEKVMGRRKGEPLARIREIEIVSVHREQLADLLTSFGYGQAECDREGFPEMTPDEFVSFFCRSHKGCTPYSDITRIEFRYVL
jgi:hypothetical protein